MHALNGRIAASYLLPNRKLPSNNLTGTLARALEKLTVLDNLQLGGNKISGELDSALTKNSLLQYMWVCLELLCTLTNAAAQTVYEE